MSDDTLTAAEIVARLEGEAPEPFVVGRRLELVMDNGRLVRGVVKASGTGAAQLVVGFIPRWRDNRGNWRPGYPHMNVIVYDQVRRWADANKAAPDGTWMPEHPGFRAQANLAGTSEWHEWRPAE